MQGSVRRAATLLHGRRTGLPTIESAAYASLEPRASPETFCGLLASLQASGSEGDTDAQQRSALEIRSISD